MTATVALRLPIALLLGKGPIRGSDCIKLSTILAPPASGAPGLLHQFVFENLSCRGRGQDIEHDDFTGSLVRGELRAAERLQFVDAGCRALPQLDERDDLFVA